MKKLILVLLFISTFSMLVGVKGQNIATPFSDYYTFNPRFRYLTDTTGDLKVLSMAFEQEEDTGDTLYKIDLEQLDSNGNVINILKTDYLDLTYSAITENYLTYFRYGWDDRSVVDVLNENEIVYYRIIYNNSVVLHTGGVMLRPEFTENETSRVEFGEYVYNTGGLVDLTDQTQFTYNINKDNVMILHYRFNSDVEVQGVSNFIMLRDLYTMTTEFSLDSEDILTLQGGSTIDFRNSFLPIFIKGGYPEFLNPDSIDLDFNDILYQELGLGTYLVYLEGNTFNYITSSEATALLNIANFDKAFSLTVNYDSVDLIKKQKVTFYKDNEISDSVYTTILARDQQLLEDWTIEVESRLIFPIAYSVLQTLEAGDNVDVIWQLEPTILPFSIPTTNYIISDISDYTIAGGSNIKDSMTTSIDWFGWNNEIGLLFISVALLVLATVIMAIRKAEAMVIIFVDGALLGLLSFLGFLPVWFLIGEVVIIALGIMLKFSRGGSE